MKKSHIWFTILSILAGGFLFVSFFVDQPAVKAVGDGFLLWAERMFAVLLFFAVADGAILLVRKAGNGAGMRIVRMAGFTAFLIVLLLGLIRGPEAEDFNQAVYTVQRTLESALAGLVCISLIYAVYRLPGQQPSAMKTGFFIGLVLFLIIYSGIPRMISLPDAAVNVIGWIEAIPQGALTGLLLGAALGGAFTGLRYIFSGKFSAKEDK